MPFYGELTGKFYDSIQAMRHEEGREAQRRNVRTPEEEAFDALPNEKVCELVERAAASDQQKAAQAQCSIDIAAFLQAHPEYQDCQENTDAMKFCLEGMGVDTKSRTSNFYQLEEAYNHLKAGGFLKLKTSEVNKQAEQAVANRVEQIKRERERTFDDWSAYNELSLDELRQRADDQLSGNSRAEVGGMGAEYEVTVKAFGGHPLDDPSRRVTPGSQFNRRGFGQTPRRF